MKFLPTEIKHLILNQLEPKDLKNTSLVDKEFKGLSQSLLLHKTNANKLLEGQTFFAVAGTVKCIEPPTIIDSRGIPRTQANKQKITPTEVVASLNRAGTVKLFSSWDEATLYACSISDAEKQEYTPIFAVQLTKNTVAKKTTTKVGDYLPDEKKLVINYWSVKPDILQVDGYRLKSEEVNLVACADPANKTRCTIS